MLTVKPFDTLYKTGFTVEGHAEFAEHGQDIVCSAVSAMTQMTLYGLEKHSEIESKIESGDMSVHIVEPDEFTNVLMNSLINGLRILQMQRPEYINIQEEDNDKD